MNKEWLKLMAVQLGVQSVFIAADEVVRTLVRERVRPVIKQPRLADSVKDTLDNE